MAKSNPVTRALDGLKHNLEKLVTSYQQAMQRRKGALIAGRTLKALQTIPGPPRYPIRWTSERQRKAFFATNGFGRGIPTRRTGRIAADWQVAFIVTQEGGLFVLSNPHSAAKFVHGPDPFAQGFHVDTGWTQVDDIQNGFYNEWVDIATQVFFEEVDVFEGL